MDTIPTTAASTRPPKPTYAGSMEGEWGTCNSEGTGGWRWYLDRKAPPRYRLVVPHLMGLYAPIAANLLGEHVAGMVAGFLADPRCEQLQVFREPPEGEWVWEEFAPRAEEKAS